MAYAEWTGRHRSQIEGKHLSEVLPEEVLGQIVPFILRVLEGECVTHEAAVRHLASDARHLSFRYVPDPDGFIAAHRRVQCRLSTKDAITQSLWEARSIEEAATGVLGALCRYLGCRVSVLWLQGSDGRLHSASVVAPSEATRGIIAAGCSEIAFGRGEGAIGRVWESAQPAIFANVVDVPDFCRKDLAHSEGLAGLVAFPLTLGDRVIGVLEFLFEASEEPDADLMSMLTGIASQLAQFVERVRVEEALRQSEWRLMLMTDLVPQLIWSAWPAPLSPRRRGRGLASGSSPAWPTSSGARSRCPGLPRA